jgi:protein-S-isoprenylcysteine O-methyltransferase Ste14
MRSPVLKFLYGLFFVAVVPLALFAWAHATRGAVRLSALHSSQLGGWLLGAGLAVMLAGMASLWRFGGGLPMNAFPPPRLVERGIYSVVPHPIYGGFTMICAGVAIFTGSPSGLWLVTPSVALACSALVLGYEMPDLRRRFGVPAYSCWLPHESQQKPALLERLLIYFVILLPWLAIFELFGALGRPVGAVSTWLPLDAHLPIIQQTELLYASTYVVVLLTPLLAVSASALRRFAQRGLVAMAVIFPLYLLLPVFVPPRPFHPLGLTGTLLAWERTPYSGTAAFPSFHVVWALIAASALAEGASWKKVLWWTWACLASLSCMTTGMHSFLDVIAGVAAFLMIIRIDRIWRVVLSAAERIANSWQEWRIGPVRIINHGGYAAAAVFVGLLIIDTLLGPGHEMVSVSVLVCAIVGAMLWAQWIEGSSALLRPMGFYGGMIGAVAGAATGPYFGVSFWIVLMAIGVAAPWFQAIGRLRCLVQGCCHGRPTPTVMGIRHTHPQSRVVRLASLAGVPVHATPVYSILWNALIGLALLRLLVVQAPATMICGVYLLLSGAGRFAEEAYRGEPQTKIWCGLHIYQWIAAFTFVAGAAMTAVLGPPAPAIAPLRLSSLFLAAAGAAFGWFAYGIDFPETSRRFARLT